MATGSAPFRGNSTTLILDAILHATPAPVRQLRPELPGALEQIIGTALEKDRELRYQTASELRAALMRLKRDAQAGAAPEAEAAAGVASSRMTRRTAIGALAGTAVGAAGVGVFGISRWSNGTPRNLTRFSIAMPEEDFFATTFNKRVAISPGGTHLAYNVVHQGVDTLYVRSLSDLQPRLGVEGGVGGAPFFSSDGQWIGFLQTILGGTLGGQGGLGYERSAWAAGHP